MDVDRFPAVVEALAACWCAHGTTEDLEMAAEFRPVRQHIVAREGVSPFRRARLTVTELLQLDGGEEMLREWVGRAAARRPADRNLKALVEALG